ncbi:unnamed protein product [Symbiodinium microadriaticum]|nr:unnamed protein product [Symbiodinium microadriaticum]CAE7940717.1 unnamed protein product [Symbiodinium sp. KB8]
MAELTDLMFAKAEPVFPRELPVAPRRRLSDLLSRVYTGFACPFRKKESKVHCGASDGTASTDTTASFLSEMPDTPRTDASFLSPRRSEMPETPRTDASFLSPKRRVTFDMIPEIIEIEVPELGLPCRAFSKGHHSCRSPLSRLMQKQRRTRSFHKLFPEDKAWVQRLGFPEARPKAKSKAARSDAREIREAEQIWREVLGKA